jgi:serine/threonine protein phosphatase PrpC
METAGGQIQGARRRQEDAFAIERIGEDAVLALVTDGLGGLPAGHIASREATEEFVRVFREQAVAGANAPDQWLHASLIAADRHLHRMQDEAPVLRGMSTTLVAIFCRADEAWAISVGDSYLMLLRNGMLYVMNELHRAGNAVTSCLGLQLAQIHALSPIPISAGDRFLLASDGITTLGEASIKQCLASAADARQAADTLLRSIEQAGAAYQDNATVVAIVP